VVRWYYSTNGKAEGPVTVDFLLDQLKAGKFTLVDLVFKEGESAWKTFGEIPEFRDAYQALPPLVPKNEIDLDEISIDDFTPTPILTQTAPAAQPAPVNREEPVQTVAVAAPVVKPEPVKSEPVKSSFYTEPVAKIVVPESMAVKEFMKPDEGWPSDWRLSSSWIVLRKRSDGSGYDQDGPFTAEHIIEMIGQGKVEYSQYCWKPGYTRWFRIGNLPEFDRRKRDRDNDTVNQIIPVPAIAEALPALTREELLANVERLRREKKDKEKVPSEASTKNLIETPLDRAAQVPMAGGASGKKPVIVTPASDFDPTAIAPMSAQSAKPADTKASDAKTFGSSHAARTDDAVRSAVDTAPRVPPAWQSKALLKKTKGVSPKALRFGLAAFVALAVVAYLAQMTSSRKREPASQQQQQQAPKPHKKGKVGEADKALPPTAPAPPAKVASMLEITPKNLESAAILAFPSDMGPGEKVVVKLKGKTGDILQYSSFAKTFEVPKGETGIAQLDLVKEGIPAGTYFVEASVGTAQSATQIFVGKHDGGFIRDLERHIKSISLRQQNEKSALFYGSQRLEKLAKELVANGQALKAEPAKWKKTHRAWMAQAREAAMPVIALARSPANDMTYPEQIAAFQAATERLAAQAKDIDGTIMQKREVASNPEDLSVEFARLREDSGKLSGRPQASN
jgi:hypothetical protein